MIEQILKAIVAGAGPAGLAVACLCAQDGAPTALIAPERETDARTVAIMDPAMRLLSYIGVWPGELKASCAPLRRLAISDETGHLITAPSLDFASSELELDAFGWNVPLSALIPLLRQRAEKLGISVIDDTVAQSSLGNDTIRVVTVAGRALEAKIAIAADGANSLLRSQAGIAVQTWSFDQSALATSFAHSGKHADTSFEIHTPDGPFTTVPLPGDRSSLVWMGRPARINELNRLDDAQLATEIQLQTHGRLGRVSDLGPRAVFPMKGQRALSMAARRVMLVGEAAHVFPPIGAQGLNLSLRDAGHAADLVIANDDPGADKCLLQYEHMRRGDLETRIQAISAVNWSFLGDILGATLTRAAAFQTLNVLPPLRRFVMQEGLAPGQHLPFAMRADAIASI